MGIILTKLPKSLNIVPNESEVVQFVALRKTASSQVAITSSTRTCMLFYKLVYRNYDMV